MVPIRMSAARKSVNPIFKAQLVHQGRGWSVCDSFLFGTFRPGRRHTPKVTDETIIGATARALQSDTAGKQTGRHVPVYGADTRD